MRRLLPAAVASLVLMVGLSAWVTAQSSASVLEGAWAVQDLSYATPPTTPVNKPVGLLVVSGRHYSLTIVTNAARPDLAQAGAATATADQLRAVWGPLTANAGTFTITGNTFKMMQSVAKNPGVMDAGSFSESTFVLKGDTLVLTAVRNDTGPAANPSTTRLTRVR